MINKLGHSNGWVRAGFAYIFFFIFLFTAFLAGLLLLPEGALKEFPFIAAITFDLDASPVTNMVNTLLYNLFVLLMIIGSNHLRVRSFTFGYLPLYANTIIIGLFAGTNSFSGDISPYSLQGWLFFLQIGFLEFSAYILGCVATTPLAMYHADKWRGEQFKKIRNLREYKLSKIELYFLVISLVLLVIAATNEWRLFT